MNYNDINSNLYCELDFSGEISDLLKKIEKKANEEEQQTYVIKQPLIDRIKYEYDYKDAVVILIPKHKIVILNYGKELDLFDDYFDDFIEDLGHLSDKYNYKNTLGRPKVWKKLIKKVESIENIEDIEAFYKQNEVNDKDERIVDLLISLLIGSINDIEKIGSDVPETVLDKVKKKILLFDGLQSRFIYRTVPDKVVKIQGLAGTGKTELLLHKLKNQYIEDNTSRIAFTCFNKVLAAELKNRVPQFFNFMKVDEQIEWGDRLLVFSSWGSNGYPESGMYSYICNKYGLTFRRYSYMNSFDRVCKLALEELENKDNIEYCFDYVYIDESQDFPESFFKLCEKVTSKKIFIAGDIFQNVFDVDMFVADCHYLLNRCYRTDPRTLMLAHSIGMGLFEKPVIRWLEDSEWTACGYIISRKNEFIKLERSKIRRFEDIEYISHSIKIKSTNHNTNEYVKSVMECINEIKMGNSTVKPDDIAIVFLNNSKLNYQIMDELSWQINSEYSWNTCLGYIKKSKEKNSVFITNVNNIKGLEFPFVICVSTNIITKQIKQRNSIYMILTRSFLNSYLVINSKNEEFIDCYEKAIDSIENNKYLLLREPSVEEKETQSKKIKIDTNEFSKSLEEIIEEVCIEYCLENELKSKLQNLIPDLVDVDAHSEDEVYEEVSNRIKGLLNK